MPLRKDKRRSDAGADADGRTADNSVSDPAADSREKAGKKEAKEVEEDEEEDEAQDAWLESLGIENSEIRRINHSQVRAFQVKCSVVGLSRDVAFIQMVQPTIIVSIAVKSPSHFVNMHRARCLTIDAF